MATSESQKESTNICNYTAAIATEKNQQTTDSILKPSVSCKNNYYYIIIIIIIIFCHLRNSLYLVSHTFNPVRNLRFSILFKGKYQ